MSDINIRHFISIYHPDHVFNNKNSKPVFSSGALDIDRAAAQRKAQELSKKTAGKHVILTVVEDHKFHMGIGRVTDYTYANGRPVNRWVKWDRLTGFKDKQKTLDHDR